MRNARGSVPFGGSSTSGIGEAPQSRKFKIIIIGVIFLIALFIVMDFVDRANEKKKRGESAAGRQTTAIFGDEYARSIDSPNLFVWLPTNRL